MTLGGWRTRSIFSRYNVVSEEDMRAAQEKTEQYLQKEIEKQAESKADFDRDKLIRTNTGQLGGFGHVTI
jgi:hypothetical protein